jgi:hypothetical protein
MVFADAKRVQTHLIGVLDLLDQIARTLLWAHRATAVVERASQDSQARNDRADHDHDQNKRRVNRDREDEEADRSCAVDPLGVAGGRS